jgi:ubiquitin C-terminal hydrolase
LQGALRRRMQQQPPSSITPLRHNASDFSTPSRIQGGNRNNNYHASRPSYRSAAHSSSTPPISASAAVAPISQRPRGNLPLPVQSSSNARSGVPAANCSSALLDADIDTEAITPPERSIKSNSRLRECIKDNSGAAAPPSARGPPTQGDSVGKGVADELLGFTNIGNTCFMNSTLQCLLRTQRLRKFLLTSDLDRAAPRPAPLTTTLQEICRRMFSSSGGSSGTLVPRSLSVSSYGSSSSLFASSSRSIAPSNFKNCLASYRRAFAGFEQHDAHEFLRFTLDAVHDECNAITKAPRYEELKDVPREKIQDTAARWLDNHAKRNKSVVQDAFCGQFASETVCEECRYRSVSCETFLDLSVPVPRSGFAASNAAARGESEFSVQRALSSFHNAEGSDTSSVSITNALEEFFAPADLAGTDAYHCPSCKKPTRARRVGHIFQAPEVLVLQLKRFRHSRFMATKINDMVRFPVDEPLNIAPFMHPQAPRSDEGTLYQLQGVVHHMGSVHSGHYVAHCRCQKQGDPSPRWYEFNDSSVTPVSINSPSTSLVTPSAYILFFERVGGHHGSKL